MAEASTTDEDVPQTEGTIDIDQLIEASGGFGYYQKRMIFFLLLFVLACPFQTMSMAFVGANVSFFCLPPSYNSSNIPVGIKEDQFLSSLHTPGDSCQVYNISLNGTYYASVTGNETTSSCNYGRIFKTEFRSSVVSEFELVCERKWLKSTSKSVFFAGRLVGAVVFGQLADRFGRYPCFFISTAMLSCCGIINAFVPSFIPFIILYFFQGLWQIGAYFCAYTIVIEIVPLKYRMPLNFIMHISYAIGMMILAGIAYAVNDWRQLEIAISVPFIFFIFCWRIIPESPRWLLVRREDVKCKKLLENIARVNGVKFAINEKSLQKMMTNKNLGKVKTYTFVDLISKCSLAKLSFNVWFNWLVNSMVYYGVTLNAVNMAGNPYLNFVSMAAIEVPANVMCILTFKYFGRRLPIFFYMLFGGINCLATSFVPQKPSWIPLTLALLGKFGSTAAYGGIYLVAAELFPTLARNIGMGMSSMFSRIGGLLAPFILDLVIFVYWLPLSLFGVLSVTFGILLLLLPETSNSVLPQTIHDMEKTKV